MQGGELGVALGQGIILAEQRGVHAGRRMHRVLVRGLQQACLARQGLLQAWRMGGLGCCVVVRCAGARGLIRLLLLSPPCNPELEPVGRPSRSVTEDKVSAVEVDLQTSCMQYGRYCAPRHVALCVALTLIPPGGCHVPLRILRVRMLAPTFLVPLHHHALACQQSCELPILGQHDVSALDR